MHYLQLCKDKMNFTEYIWLLYFYHLYDIYYILPFNQKKEKKDIDVYSTLKWCNKNFGQCNPFITFTQSIFA